MVYWELYKVINGDLELVGLFKWYKEAEEVAKELDCEFVIEPVMWNL